MKIIVTKHRQWKNDNGVGYVTFRVYGQGYYQQLKHIEVDEKLSIDVEKAKGRRTLEQNRKMWALINDIDKATNGYLSNDPMGIYINALREAGAKHVTVIAMTEAEKDLKKVFRAVEFKNRPRRLQAAEDKREKFMRRLRDENNRHEA